MLHHIWPHSFEFLPHLVLALTIMEKQEYSGPCTVSKVSNEESIHPILCSAQMGFLSFVFDKSEPES
jgi:hypothetical protein